jgi:hypothetical protein
VTSTAKAKLDTDAADTFVVFVAIEADAMKLRDEIGGGAPRLDRYATLHRNRRSAGEVRVAACKRSISALPADTP